MRHDSFFIERTAALAIFVGLVFTATGLAEWPANPAPTEQKQSICKDDPNFVCNGPLCRDDYSAAVRTCPSGDGFTEWTYAEQTDTRPVGTCVFNATNTCGKREFVYCGEVRVYRQKNLGQCADEKCIKYIKAIPENACDPNNPV